MILNVFVVASSVYLVMKAYQIKNRGGLTLKWQGLVTTILTATVYCISGVPYLIFSILVRFFPQIAFNTQLINILLGSFSLNIISNFYIYCLTVTSFRQFLWSRVRGSRDITSTSGISIPSETRGKTMRHYTMRHYTMRHYTMKHYTYVIYIVNC
jgi:hypothetical protein